MAGRILSGHQTSRVVLVNGRTIILQGSSGNVSSPDINEGFLQQAFQDVSDTEKLDDSTIENALDQGYVEDGISVSDGVIKEPFLAVLQDHQGENQTIQLTAEQAKALGIHFISENDGTSLSQLSDLSIGNGITLNDMTQMVYSDGGDQNASETMFECQDMDESLVMDEEIDETMENEESLDHSSSLAGSNSRYSPINGNHQITLIPQMIGGQMTYTVKLPDDLDDPEEQFEDMSMPLVITEDNNAQALTSSGVKFLDITASNRSKTLITTTSYNSLTSPFPTTVQSVNNTQLISVGSSLLNKKPHVSYATLPLRSAVTNIGNPLNAPMKMISTSSRSLLNPDIFKSKSIDTSSIPMTTSQELRPKPTNPSVVTTAKERKTTTTLVPVNVGKYTNVMASEGRLLTVPTTKTPNQLESEVSAAMTKMPVHAINKSKPLGSSENPIQLVQHGQTFHSVQSLNQEQLKQIATVLQRQHLETPPSSTKKNTIYNAETNTRIIYRVVYPEDLDMKDGAKGASLSVRGRARRGRPPKSAAARGGVGRGTALEGLEPRVKQEVNVEEDRLNDDAKCERKKQIARTRSGRVSRPPRHMVKDYKRLHHLDFADPDLDDSDGGYSDYQTPEVDKEEVDNKPENLDGKPKELLSGLVSSKRKISSHFRCPTCQKIYLGHNRMSRHFEAYPDHEAFREPTAADEFTVAKSNGLMKTPAARGRGKRRGFWTPEARSDRRKAKLREVIATCEATELSEVAGQSVAASMSLWELVLLRVAAVRSGESCVATLCDELGALAEKLRSVAAEILLPIGNARGQPNEEIDLQDEAVSALLNIPCGRYTVNDQPLAPVDIPNPNKRLKTDEDGPTCPDVLSALTLVAKKPTPDDVATLDLPAVDVAHDDLNIADFVNAPGAMSESSTSLDDAHLMTSLDQFQSDTTKSVWGKEKAIHGEVFDPEIALAAMGEGDLGDRLSSLRDQTHGEFPALEDSRGADDLDEDLALDAMEGEAGAVERALAAMGEGDQLDEVSFDPGVSLMEEDETEYRNNVNSSSSSYDPESALSVMEGDRESDKVDDSRTFPGLGLADVNSDESNSELDFEALSEEFNRNTSHES